MWFLFFPLWYIVFTFRDESQAITLTGIENFFLQGKLPQLNRARPGRRKGRNLPHQADAKLVLHTWKSLYFSLDVFSLSEECDDDDAENEDTAEQFSHCDLGLLRDYFNVCCVKLSILYWRRVSEFRAKKLSWEIRRGSIVSEMNFHGGHIA